MRCVISCYTSSTFFCWKIVIASRLWPYLPHMHNNNNSNKNNNKNTKTNEWHNMCLTYFRYSHFVECAKNYMRIYIYWNHNLFVGVIGIKMISVFTGEFWGHWQSHSHFDGCRYIYCMSNFIRNEYLQSRNYILWNGIDGKFALQYCSICSG